MIKDIVCAISVITMIIVFLWAMISWDEKQNESVYNNGVCEHCNDGKYELFDISRGKNGYNYYYYRCNNCNYIISTNTNMDVEEVR